MLFPSVFRGFFSINFRRQFWSRRADADCALVRYGPGCFVDQLCAAGLSSAVGFGHLFGTPAHEHSARLSILKNNVVTAPAFADQQKHFYPGDSGITVCTYPNGKYM